jgi:D-lactate dehydrogenase (cytochrome)
VTTDVCVPISKLPEMVTKTREDVDKSGVVGPMFGHVGDGNFHVILLFDPAQPDEYRKCKEVAGRMAHLAMELGGTVTGEHGVGTGKISLLRDMVGDTAISTMLSIKQALDPKGIMNPGKVLPS